MLSNNEFLRLYKLISTAAFGWNQRLKEVLDEYHENLKMPKTYAFYEYFFHRPLKRKEKSQQDDRSDIILMAPFADRILDKSAVCAFIGRNGKAQTIFQRRDAEPTPNWTDLTRTRIAWSLYWMWSEYRERIPIKEIEIEKILGPGARLFAHKKELSGLTTELNPFDIFWISTNGVRINGIEEKLGEINDIFDQYLHKEVNIFKCYYPHVGGEEIPSVAIPIASHNLFYGSLWIWLPLIKELVKDGEEEKRLEYYNKLVENLGKIIIESYAPTLALLHNHFLETICSENKKGNDYRIKVVKLKEISLGKLGNHEIRYFNPFLACKYSPDVIESGISHLWEKRGHHYPDNLDPDKLSEFNGTLVFKDYLVCSPEMIKLIRNVMTKALTFKKTGKSLPAAIVIGGPGSGKEIIAKMLRLFTQPYWMGNEYTINMAAVRPAPITGPVVVGLSLGTPFQFKGILTKIREETGLEFGKKEIPDPNWARWPTLILDELNSMDPDSQGTLLRFLENSEILPIGSVKDPPNESALREDLPAWTNCLVIGVMNEDPDEITREKAIEFIKSRGYLGGLLGDWLYESFMRIRRLRPDLKYRMIRGGKFAIPPLRERREDIPLLFYVYVDKELRAIHGDRLRDKPDIDIPAECNEFLMSREFIWPGNIRQLQSVAKNVAALIHGDDRDKILIDDFKDIKAFIVKLKKGSDSLSNDLKSKFDRDTKRLLREYDGKGSPPRELKKTLIEVLKILLEGQNLSDGRLLTRMLLDQAYPDEIWKSNRFRVSLQEMKAAAKEANLTEY